LKNFAQNFGIPKKLWEKYKKIVFRLYLTVQARIWPWLVAKKIGCQDNIIDVFACPQLYPYLCIPIPVDPWVEVRWVHGYGYGYLAGLQYHQLLYCVFMTKNTTNAVFNVYADSYAAS
jgi:hypothetical protein